MSEITVYAYWRLTADAERPPFRNVDKAFRTYAVRMTEHGDITGVCGPIPDVTPDKHGDLLPYFRYDEDDLSHALLDYVITHSGDFRQVGGQVQR